MHRDRVERNWKQFSGNVREQWSKLLGDESDANAATRTQLAGSVQVRYGTSNEEAGRQLRNFLFRNRDVVPDS